MQQIRSLATGMITGRLGGVPEPIGKGASGVQVSIAVKELLPAQDSQNPKEEREDATHWFRVSLWGEARAKWALENLGAGDIVCCNVQLHTREYRPDGAKKPITVTNMSVPPNWDFVLLHRHEPDGKKQDNRAGGAARGRGNQGGRGSGDGQPTYQYDDPRDDPRSGGGAPAEARGRGARRDLPPPEPPPEQRTARGRGR